MNENLKKQEQDFKAHCKEEMARLKAQIEELKEGAQEEDSEDKVNIMQSQQVLEEIGGGGGGGCKRLSLSFILLKGVSEYFLVGASFIVTCFIHGHSG